jgi:Cft2 family RNA processing exonuclease
MRPEDLLLPTPSGVCCKTGGFYIDPTRPVDRALITHGHSDHARAGHGAVLATQETLDDHGGCATARILPERTQAIGATARPSHRLNGR